MVDDDGDLIPRDAFIPTAERFGLINELDRWVTGEAMTLAERGKRVTVNLSAHSIGDSAVLERVRKAAQRGVQPGAVIFEITETAAMSNIQEARAFTEQLNELGYEVALDDFGTGFGSFSYLKHLPTRYLKIDVEFVRELASNETDRSEEHTSELQSHSDLVCRLLLEKKKHRYSRTENLTTPASRVVSRAHKNK